MWYNKTHDNLITFNIGLGTLKTKSGGGRRWRMCWAGSFVLRDPNPFFFKEIKLSRVWYSHGWVTYYKWALNSQLYSTVPPPVSEVGKEEVMSVNLKRRCVTTLTCSFLLKITRRMLTSLEKVGAADACSVCTTKKKYGTHFAQRKLIHSSCASQNMGSTLRFLYNLTPCSKRLRSTTSDFLVLYCTVQHGIDLESSRGASCVLIAISTLRTPSYSLWFFSQ